MVRSPCKINLALHGRPYTSPTVFLYLRYTLFPGMLNNVSDSSGLTAVAKSRVHLLPLIMHLIVEFSLFGSYSIDSRS